MMDEIARILNFEYTIYEAPGNKYGMMNENQEWDGAVGELVNKVSALSLF